MSGLLAASCRPAEPEPPVAVAPVESVPEPELVSSPPPGPPADAVDPPPAPEPPALQDVVPVELPFAERAVVVRPMVDVVPVVLFADERAVVRRKAAKTIAADGYAIVPMEELERVEAAAAQGRLVLEDDQTCVAPLLPHEVHDRYFREHPTVTVEAMCMDDCALQATLEDPLDDDVYESWRSKRVRKPHDPRAWARANLRPYEGGFGLIGLGMFGSSHPPPIMFGSPQPIGPWRQAPDGTRFGELESDLAGCANPDDRVGVSYEVRAAVGADGRVTRCTTTSDSPMALASSAACICREAVDGLRFPRGLAGRRVRVAAHDTGGSLSAATLTPTQAGTDPWVTRLRESAVLAKCEAEQSLPPRYEARAVLTLEPDGTVTEVELFGDIDTVAEMQFSRCLVGALRTVPFPCRPPGVEQLQVDVRNRED